MLTLLSTLTVLITGVTAGGLAFMARGVTLATPGLRPSTFTELHTALFHFADPIMRVLVCASALGSAALSAALAVRGDGVGSALAAIAAAAVVVVVVITETVNKPINKLVDTWSPAAPPRDWAAVRDRWNTFHRRRTLCGLLAYICAIAAALLSL